MFKPCDSVATRGVLILDFCRYADIDHCRYADIFKYRGIWKLFADNRVKIFCLLP